LAETKYNKGKSFEALIVNIINRQGYTNILSRIRSTGSELDIKATHKTNQIRILCECKAQQQQTRPQEVIRFYGKFEKEKNLGRADMGYFISLSGYTSASIAWYDELASTTKQVFLTYDCQNIVDQFFQTNILPNIETIDATIRKNTSYNIGEKYLVFFQSNLYIIQLLKNKEDTVAFMILDSNCKPVDFHISNEISRPDEQLTNYTRIDPVIIEKIILNLLNIEEKTIDQISTEIEESVKDCQIAIDDLLLQNLVSSTENSKLFRIDNSIKSFSTFVKKFESSMQIYVLMSSKYIDNAINDNFVEYVQSRYKITLDTNYTNVLKTCATIFPSVVSLLLFGDVTNFEYTYSQLKDFNPQAKNEVNSILFTFFWEQIYDAVVSDLRSSPPKYIGDKGIKGYFLAGDLKVGSGTQMILHLFVKGHTYVVKKGDTQIKAGEIMSPTDMGENINLGVHLFSIEEYQAAIKSYDLIIEHSKDDNLLAHAWNNKSQCMRMMGQHDEEEKCLANALLHVSPIIKIVLSNMVLCQESLGKNDMALKIKELLN